MEQMKKSIKEHGDKFGYCPKCGKNVDPDKYNIKNSDPTKPWYIRLMQHFTSKFVYIKFFYTCNECNTVWNGDILELEVLDESTDRTGECL